jgi:hypothetical protein
VQNKFQHISRRHRCAWLEISDEMQQEFGFMPSRGQPGY